MNIVYSDVFITVPFELSKDCILEVHYSRGLFWVGLSAGESGFSFQGKARIYRIFRGLRSSR